MTSHDVVGIMRRRFQTRRIGHAGTLDPLASGLLVVAVGPATRFLQYLDLEPKVYRARIQFGVETDSYDAEGTVVAEKAVPADLPVQIADALPRFRGLIDQLPPMYSAVKVKGQPLYKYARQGIEMERKSRRIHIARFDILESNETDVVAEIVCSGGTYIRTLAQDLGQAVGCGAHLIGLQRTEVGRFQLADAANLEEVNPGNLIPLSTALYPMLMRELNEMELARVRNGNPIPARVSPSEALDRGFRSPSRNGEEGEAIPYVALTDPSGQVISVAALEGDFLHPECVIPMEAPAIPTHPGERD